MEKRNSQLEHGQPMEHLHVRLRCDSLSSTTPESSSTMQALSSARCTGVGLYTLRIKIGTNERALGELSYC